MSVCPSRLAEQLQGIVDNLTPLSKTQLLFKDSKYKTTSQPSFPGGSVTPGQVTELCHRYQTGWTLPVVQYRGARTVSRATLCRLLSAARCKAPPPPSPRPRCPGQRRARPRGSRCRRRTERGGDLTGGGCGGLNRGRGRKAKPRGCNAQPRQVPRGRALPYGGSAPRCGRGGRRRPRTRRTPGPPATPSPIGGRGPGGGEAAAHPRRGEGPRGPGGNGHGAPARQPWAGTATRRRRLPEPPGKGAARR